MASSPPDHQHPPKEGYVRPSYLSEDPWISTEGSESLRNGKHWDRCREMLTKFDTETIESWKDEIQTQLLVASLLSALTGAFIIETQKQLSEDPIVTSAILLSHIARQLNSSISLPPTSLHSFMQPSPGARAVNSLFFTSLGLSLGNVTLGLLCLQWIRGLQLEPPDILTKDYPSFRCARHHGFRKWGAKGLIMALPLLLLGSLVCFFAGLLFFVSTEDWVVAAPLHVVLVTIFAILVVTTLLPAVVLVGYTAFHHGADSEDYAPLPPFRSLQSWIVLQICLYLGRMKITNTLFRVLNVVVYDGSVGDLWQCPDWGRIDMTWLKFTKNFLAKEKLVLPLILSTGHDNDMEVIRRCYEESSLKSSRSSDPAHRKLEVFRRFIQYGTKLPPNTLRQLYACHIGNLVRIVNEGTFKFSDLGDLSIEIDNMDLTDFSDTKEELKQLLHAMIEYAQKELPSQASFWTGFWRVLSFIVCSQARTTPLALITTALDTVAKARSDLFGTSAVYISPAFPYFIDELHSSIRTYPQLFGLTKEAKAVVAAFLCHPVWQSLVDDALASAFGSQSLRTDVQHLETIKVHHNIEAYSPYPSYKFDQPSSPTSLPPSGSTAITIHPPSPIHFASGTISENGTNDAAFPIPQLSLHIDEASPTTGSFLQTPPWPTPSIDASQEIGVQEEKGLGGDDTKGQSDTGLSSPPPSHVVINIEERKRARWARLLSESPSGKYR